MFLHFSRLTASGDSDTIAHSEDNYMVLSEADIQERLESPINLMNRLRDITKNTNKNQNLIPSLPPTSDQIVNDLEEKLKANSLKSKATSIMMSTLNELELRIVETDKPEKLARIAESMNKIIESAAPRDKANNIGQVIIYAPAVVNESKYDTIDVSRFE